LHPPPQLAVQLNSPPGESQLLSLEQHTLPFDALYPAQFDFEHAVATA
jgi:hypothetical protein